VRDLDLDECVNCGAGLIAVSDICPQCGWLKNKPIELEKSEEKIEIDIELDKDEEKIEIDIKNNPSTKDHTEIKNKISRPAGVRLLGIFHMAFGISLVVFGILFGSAVIFLVMSSGMSSLGGIGDVGNMPMLPGMGGIDPSTMSSLDMIIGLNEIAGSPSASEIEVRMNSAGVLNIDVMTEVITETSVIAIIEIVLGLFAVIVGRGLFKGKKWARPVTIVSSIISIPLVVLFVDNLNNLILLGIAAFDGMVLYYMLKPKVKEYFNQTSIKKSVKKSKIKTTRTVNKSKK
jgi:hypothetical protein